jgi:hypothetical protein
MSYTFEDFRQDLARELLQELAPEEILKGLGDEEIARLKALLDRRRNATSLTPRR